MSRQDRYDGRLGSIMDGLELQRFFEESAARGYPPVYIALEQRRMDLVGKHDMWPDIADDDAGDDVYPDVDLLAVGGGILHEYAAAISASVQFPKNTAFLHGLAVTGAAAVRSFSYHYHGQEKPVNLYAVTAQPPSTGKSAINSMLFNPVRIAYGKVNERHAKIRNEAQTLLAKLKGEYEKADQPQQQEAIFNDICEQQKIIESHPNYVSAVDDATPEAAESVAGNQGGLINIVSDEADAINVILGAVYSDTSGGRKANYGIFLKAWDGDYHAPSRVTRKTVEGPVRGSLAVIAQDESIRSILQAGASGRGISERILLLRERNLFGQRDHMNYTPVDPGLRCEWAETMHNIVAEQETILQFDHTSMVMLRGYRQNMEEKLADGEEYSHSMLRGAVGKADKQIMKIASILHILNEWRPGGGRLLKVPADRVMEATKIYTQLCKTYISAADSQGVMGESAELKCIIERLANMKEKRMTNCSIARLRDNIKSYRVFAGASKLTERLRNDLLPELQHRGYCVLYKNTIWINPKLR